MEEGTEWTLPNLKRLDLSDVKTTHIKVNYALPKSVGVDNGGRLHQISLTWKDKRHSAKAWNYHQLGLELPVSKERMLFVDVRDCATKLSIVAPSATKIHLKRCKVLKELDIDSPLLLDLVVGNSVLTIKKMVESFSKKCPWLKKVTLEL